MKTKQQIIEQLQSLTANGLMQIHNEYCQSVNNCDNEIYHNEEYFFNYFFSSNPMELAKAISFGDYRYHDEFVKLDAYGNLESFDTIMNHIDIDAIAEDIIKNSNSYSLTLN